MSSFLQPGRALLLEHHCHLVWLLGDMSPYQIPKPEYSLSLDIMKGNAKTLEKNNYFSTFTITECRKVTEDIEDNNRMNTTYKCVHLKMYELKRLEGTELLSETEMLVTGLERQKSVADITTVV